MKPIRILVCDDDERYRQEVPDVLKHLGDAVQIDVVGDYETGVAKIRDESYDLAVVDLSLRDGSDELGMSLLGEIRSSRRNRSCGVVILTAHATTRRVSQALDEYKVYKVTEKEDFTEADFLNTARSAIREARIKDAGSRDSNRYNLTISFGQNRLLSSKLIGPSRRTIRTDEHIRQFDVADLVRRADLLNWMIINGGPEIWRPESRSIGKAIYEVLANERQILADLTAARALAQQSSDIWIQFSGPAIGVGIPFELLRDEDESFALNHILTRQLTFPGSNLSRKTESFYNFIASLQVNQERLRILIIGPDNDDLADAEEEAILLKESIQVSLNCMGIANIIDVLIGDNANYTEVAQSLRDNDYHIIHYAGHGYDDDALPEQSGLSLRDGNGLRTLTAADLNSLTRNKELRLVFLSDCLSARTASHVGRGDFHSVFEALAKADVPIVAGYRWEVADEPAKHFAEVFYNELWRTFSPGEAMLKARQNASRGTQGRDDDTWASPVLLMQNS